MKSRVRSLVAAACLFSLPSYASADVKGDWLVEGGLAKVRIAECSGRIWGALAWEKTPGGLDEHNPDVTKRTRPTLGIILLSDMKQDGNGWTGRIYNADNGKSYSSSIKLGSTPDKLAVKGCILGVLCGGQTWTRNAPPYSLSTTPQKPAATRTTNAVSPEAGSDVGDVCRLPEVLNWKSKG